MTPLALSLLGVESTPSRRRRQDPAHGDAEVPVEVRQVPELRPARSSRNRATSYYNNFQTTCSTTNDDPPSYEVAARQRIPQRHPQHLRETLPGYTCTVEKSAKVLIQLETTSPLQDATESEWREVFLVLRGTLLSFHRVKDNGPGKLLRSYTLQHAEVGLALDEEHTVLVPQTRLARLIPSSARRKAMLKDPDLFREVRQHLLRIRVETDQIVVAHAAEEQIHEWIQAMSAGIDIAYSLDERSLPRLCTVPRRRRRQRTSQTGDISDAALIAEQERILREMYPGFAQQSTGTRPELERTVTATTEAPSTAVQTPSREEDELDLAAIREDAGTSDDRRPHMSRNITSDSVHSAFSADMMYETLPTNFSSDGKWQPRHTRTSQQIQRYIRRCMPVLLNDAIRASDILVFNGVRVKINWRTELLEEWELQPPSYKSHHFDVDLGLERTLSSAQHSVSECAPQDQDNNPNASTSDLGAETDEINTCIGTRPTTLNLSKSAVLSAMDKGLQRETSSPVKAQPARHPGQDVHGVVFCF